MSAQKKSFSEEFPAEAKNADLHAAKKPAVLVRDADEQEVALEVEPPSPTPFPREYEAHGTYIF
jgi:hypothetical protein